VGREEREINLSTRPRPLIGACVLALLSVGLLVTAGPAQGTVAGSVVAWGCGGGLDFGQCTVPAAAASGVTAIAAGPFQNLALTPDSSVFSAGLAGTAGGIGLRDAAAKLVDSAGYGSATNAFVETHAATAPPSTAPPGSSDIRLPDS
jgi:hypothetical protein